MKEFEIGYDIVVATVHWHLKADSDLISFEATFVPWNKKCGDSTVISHIFVVDVKLVYLKFS